MSYDLGNYVDVKTRIELALAKYPELSLQFEFKGTLESNPAYIWGIAYAYRTPDDPRPGIGTAAELAEGKTPYTRGSEIMVLETSAWGRALASIGIGLSAGVASADEVKASNDRKWTPSPDTFTAEVERRSGAMTPKQLALIKSMFNNDFGSMTRYVDEFKQRNGIAEGEKLSSVHASQLIDELKTAGYVPIPNTKKAIDPESKD